MKKLLLSIILISALFASSEAICSMPVLYGIKPGMTKAEAEKHLNQKIVTEKSKVFSNVPEVRSAYIYKIKGIESLSLDFYNKVVYSVLVVYDDSIKWKSLAEFAETSAKNLQLPDIQWQFLDAKFQTTSPGSAKYARFNCSNFQLFAARPSNYSLGVMDTDVFAAIDKISRLKATQKIELKLPE